MACALGVEQSCPECRMCGRGRPEKKTGGTGCEMDPVQQCVPVQQSNQGQCHNWDIPGQISMEEYLQGLK